MAGPEPRDTYNPVPQAEPVTQAPNDTLSVRAEGASFGSQLGQAKEQLGESQMGVGKAIAGVGGQAVDVAIAQQGIFNEAASNAADMKLAVEGGKIDSAYKANNEGFSAAQNKDKAVQAYTALNQQIRSSLNPAAARAYDQMANRRAAYTIAGMNDYAVAQTKVALKAGSQASMQMNEDLASQYSIASDDGQFGFQMGSVKHDLNNYLTNPAFGGILAGVPSTEKADGTLQFDTNTPDGKSAQDYYDNNLKQEMGKIWTNRINAIATDPVNGSYTKALDMLNKYGNQIPVAARNELNGKYHTVAQDEQIHGYNESILSNFKGTYLNQPAQTGVTQSGTASDLSTPLKPSNNNLGNVKTEDGKAFANPATPVDGVIHTANNLRGPLYSGKTLQQIGQTWLGTTGPDATPQKVADWVNTVSKIAGVAPGTVPDLNNPQVVTSLMKGVAAAEKSPEDRKLFTDDTISQGVIGSFDGQKPTLNQSPVTNTGIPGFTSRAPNFVDALRLNEPMLEQQARDAVARSGGDSVLQDKAAAQMHTRITEQVSAQDAQGRALADSFVQKVMDPKSPITSMYSLLYGDQQTRLDWATATQLNPYLEPTIERLVAANAAGQSKSYGTAPYITLQDIWNKKVTDPTQLSQYGLGGDDAPLSASGFLMSQKEIANMQTPQGQAFGAAASKFMTEAHDTMTGTSRLPVGVYNPAGEKRLNTALQSMMPQIEAKRDQMTKEGKDPTTMFLPTLGGKDNPDYVGKGIVPATQQEILKLKISDILAKKTAAMAGKTGADVDAGATNLNLSEADTYTKLNDKNTSDKDFMTYMNYAKTKGWNKPPQ